MGKVIPPKGIDDVFSYSTISLLQMNMSKKWSIKLGYGYDKSGKNVLWSDRLLVSKLDDAIKLINIFDSNRKTDNEEIDMDLLLATEEEAPAVSTTETVDSLDENRTDIIADKVEEEPVSFGFSEKESEEK